MEVFDVCETSKQQHCEQKHPDQNLDRLSFKMYIGKILLASGQGHTEKNLLLAMMQMCKIIFFDVVCDKMVFKSENRKNFVTNCGDHHVIWQIFQIT